MDSHDALLSNLVDHCVGAGNPSMALLSEGKLPKTWASKYLALLDRASNVWRSERAWPRELVGCLHFAAMLLPGRYDVWKRSYFKGNPHTERQLAKVCGASAVFLVSGIAGRETGGVELDEDGSESR